MVIRVLVATLFVAATGVLVAQTVYPVRVAQGPTKVYGAGTTTCSQWLKVAGTARPDPIHMSWMMGYLSASSLTQDIQPDYVHGFINGHCEQQPDSTLAVAAKALLVSLN